MGVAALYPTYDADCHITVYPESDTYLKAIPNQNNRFPIDTQ